jgi:chaperone required for assembly of F1-ATPase
MPVLADELRKLVLQPQCDTPAQQQPARDQQAATRRKSSNPIVTLNVGGQVFCTRRSTLQQFPESLLAKLVSDEWQDAQQRDADGRVFLDMDPCVFDALLQFLRWMAAPDPAPDPAPAP